LEFKQGNIQIVFATSGDGKIGVSPAARSAAVEYRLRLYSEASAPLEPYKFGEPPMQRRVSLSSIEPRSVDLAMMSFMQTLADAEAEQKPRGRAVYLGAELLEGKSRPVPMSLRASYADTVRNISKLSYTGQEKFEPERFDALCRLSETLKRNILDEKASLSSVYNISMLAAVSILQSMDNTGAVPSVYTDDGKTAIPLVTYGGLSLRPDLLLSVPSAGAGALPTPH
jgi:hypothetical protein